MDIFISVLVTSLVWLLILFRIRRRTIDGVITVTEDENSLLYSMTLYTDPEEIRYNDRLVLKIEK